MEQITLHGVKPMMSLLLPEKTNTCRFRKRNFSSNERKRLRYLINKRIDVIGCKKLDAHATTAKKEAWEDIVRQFNKHTENGKRTVAQLMKWWLNEKNRQKKGDANSSSDALLFDDGSDGGEAPSAEDDDNTFQPQPNNADGTDYVVMENGEVVFKKNSEHDSKDDGESSMPTPRRMRPSWNYSRYYAECNERDKKKEDMEIELLQIKIEEAKVRRETALIEKEKAEIERNVLKDRMRAVNGYPMEYR